MDWLGFEYINVDYGAYASAGIFLTLTALSISELV